MNRTFVILFSALLLAAGPARGDGKAFPPRAVLKDPAIPVQRAVLAYRDGVQTLTIETTFDGEGDRFGWVIPLPAAPTRCEESSSGLLELLDANLQPRIIHDLSSAVELAAVAAVVLTLAFVAAGPLPDMKGFLGKAAGFAVIALAVAVTVLMPSLAKGPAASAVSAGVRMLDAYEAGNYSVEVLQADNAEALGRWLEANGFRGLSAADRTVVQEYTDQGWCFVAARLNAGDGAVEPHPIRMTFPADTPVYPMRLTSTVGSDLHLDLYVVSDQRAGTAVLDTVCADRFRSFEYPSFGEAVPAYRGEEYEQVLGAALTGGALWDGCFVTRLSGRLAPLQMREDIWIQWQGTGPHRAVHVSDSGRDRLAWIAGLHGWWVGLTAAGLGVRRFRPRMGRLKALVFGLAGAAVLSGVAITAVVAAITPVAVHVERTLPALDRHRFRSLLSLISTGLNIAGIETWEKAESELDQFLACARIPTAQKSGFIERAESPGDVAVVVTPGGQLALQGYTSQGIPLAESGGDHGMGSWWWWDQYLNSNRRARLVRLALDRDSRWQAAECWAEAMVCLYTQQPRELISPLLEDIDSTPASDPLDENPQGTIERLFCMLACITHIEPPVDVGDAEAVRRFLDAVRGWTGPEDSV